MKLDGKRIKLKKARAELGEYIMMNGIAVILIFAAVFAAFYLFMIMPRIWKRPDMKPFRRFLYAHRGLHDNSADAPENSMKAFLRAVEAGYGIELDVQMTKDRVPVVFHDFSLKRVCREEGKVSDYTYQELQAFRLFESEERIPRFEDVLRLVDGKVPLIVELKIEKLLDTSVCSAGDKLLAGYKGIYCIESFHPLAVFWYRRHRRNVVRGQLADAFLKQRDKHRNPFCFFLEYLLFNWLSKPDFIAYNHQYPKALSRRFCRSLYHSTAAAWTIKSEEQLKTARKNFDIFIFDSFITGERA